MTVRKCQQLHVAENVERLCTHHVCRGLSHTGGGSALVPCCTEANLMWGASESNWNKSTHGGTPPSCPCRSLSKTSSLLLSYPASCQYGFNHKLSSVAQGTREASYCSRIQHKGQCSSVCCVQREDTIT